MASGINSLYSMVKGMFRQDRLLEIIKNFVFFPDQSKNELKVVCRYPQFFAATAARRRKGRDIFRCDRLRKVLYYAFLNKNVDEK